MRHIGISTQGISACGVPLKRIVDEPLQRFKTRGIILKKKVDYNATVGIQNCSACLERLTEMSISESGLYEMWPMTQNSIEKWQSVIRDWMVVTCLQSCGFPCWIFHDEDEVFGRTPRWWDSPENMHQAMLCQACMFLMRLCPEPRPWLG